MKQFFSIALTLFLVMDALGAIPAYLSLIQHIEKKKAKWIALREAFISLALMVLFFYAGDLVLKVLSLDKATVTISGGLMLFLIAIRLTFSKEPRESGIWKDGRHIIVPIATPLIASPSMLALLMIFSKSPIPNPTVLLALLLAWFFSALVYFFAHPIHNLLKDKGLVACQRLMGLLIALIAVQMFLQGVQELFI